MANATKDTSTMSIYQKLAKARQNFLKANIQKSGINDQAEFEYFELRDIVPPATKILTELGLLFIVTFPDGVPTGTLYDFDSDSILVFNSPRVEGELLTIKGNKIMMNIQGEGAKQTYHRRYLYMQLLDIVETDAIDGAKENEKNIDNPSGKKAPVSPEKRDEIKKQVTNSKGQAEPIQIEQLKKALSALNKVDPAQEEFIQEIVVKTNNFKEITKEACSQLILKVGELIDQCKEAE